MEVQTTTMREELVQLLSQHTSILDAADDIKGFLSDFSEVPQDVASWLKTIVQTEAQAAWWVKKWGYITAATGVGKSLLAINIMEECVNLFLSRNITPKILLVVPTENLRDSNWPEEFKKWDSEHLMQYVTPICYKSLPTVVNEHFQLVVLDEWHNITPVNSVYFYQNKTDALLALSATKPRDLLKLEVAAKLQMTEVYRVTLDTAVKLHLVTPYELTVITLPLDNVDKYIPSGKKNNPFKSTEARRITYLSSQIEDIKKDLKGLPRMDEDFNLLPPKFPPAVARGMLKNLSLNRMRTIYNLKSKLRAAQHVLSLFDEDERILTFCGSIEHADTLAVEGRTFHSKLKGKGKSQHLDAFKAKEINRLTCVNSLNEGQNIDSVDTGLIVQLNSNELHTIQRMGRTLRYRPGHVARVIILCAENTQDEVWVREAISSLESDNIKWIKLADLESGTVSL